MCPALGVHRNTVYVSYNILKEKTKIQTISWTNNIAEENIFFLNSNIVKERNKIHKYRNQKYKMKTI